MNAIENFNCQLRKVTKSKTIFQKNGLVPVGAHVVWAYMNVLERKYPIFLSFYKKKAEKKDFLGK